MDDMVNLKNIRILASLLLSITCSGISGIMAMPVTGGSGDSDPFKNSQKTRAEADEAIKFARSDATITELELFARHAKLIAESPFAGGEAVKNANECIEKSRNAINYINIFNEKEAVRDWIKGFFAMNVKQLFDEASEEYRSAIISVTEDLDNAKNTSEFNEIIKKVEKDIKNTQKSFFCCKAARELLNSNEDSNDYGISIEEMLQSTLIDGSKNAKTFVNLNKAEFTTAIGSLALLILSSRLSGKKLHLSEYFQKS